MKLDRFTTTDKGRPTSIHNIDMETGAPPYPMDGIPGSALPSVALSFICTCVFSSIDQTHISWTAGVVKFSDGISQSIDANASQLISGSTYIYFDLSTTPTVLKVSTTYTDAIGLSKGIVAVAKPGVAGQLAYVSSISQFDALINSDQLLAGAVTEPAILAGAVSAVKISSIYLSTMQAVVADLAALNANIGAAHINGVLDIGASGGIYQGTGTFASPTTGLKIYNSGGIGKLATYNAGVLQVYLDTDGKLYAGAGAIRLDSAGIRIKGTTSLEIIDTTDVYKGYIFADASLSGGMWISCEVGNIRIITVDGDIRIIPAGAGRYTYITLLSTANAITSTLATGTAPFSITSTTVCTNLNADLIDGSHASAFSLTSHGHAATDISWARWSMDLDPDSSVGGYHLGDATYYWGDGYINALRVNTLYARTGTVIQVSGAGTYSIGDASNYPSAVIGGYFWGNVYPWTDSTGLCGSDSYTWADCWAVTFHDVSPHKPTNFKALEALRAVKFRPDGGYDKDTLPDYCVYHNPNRNLSDTQITQRLAGMGMKDPKPPYNRKDGTDLGAMIQFNLLTNMELIELVESLQARVEALEIR